MTFPVRFLIMDSNSKISRLTMLRVNISDIAIITIKNVDYCCTIHYTSRSETINLLKNSELEDPGYIQKTPSLVSVYLRQFFFYFFCFIIYKNKMVDSEYGMDIYESAKTTIGTVM